MQAILILAEEDRGLHTKYCPPALREREKGSRGEMTMNIISYRKKNNICKKINLFINLNLYLWIIYGNLRSKKRKFVFLFKNNL